MQNFPNAYFAADRAKTIMTKATVNESPTDKLIRELKEENKRLMDMLQKEGGGGASEEGMIINIAIPSCFQQHTYKYKM